MLATVKDEKLMRITKLSWLPWIGSDFLNNEKRLLIVGESHYALGETVSDFQTDLQRHQNPNFTRKLIEETQLQELYSYKLLDNFWQAFLKRQPNKKEIWKNIAFYNFVQRSMDYSSFDGEKKEQPNAKDFKLGWNIFAEIIKIVRPTDCIFLSLKAAAGFGNFLVDPSVSKFEYAYPAKIGNMSPVEGFVVVDGQHVNISFIQHCSSFFSPKAWHSFLEDRHSDVKNFLLQKNI